MKRNHLRGAARHWLLGALGIVAILAIAATILLNPPEATPEGEQSAALYRPGDLGLEESALELVDPSRPTAANGEFGGADSRSLEGYLWQPADRDQGPYPLVVYSHGFMSSADEARYYAEFLVPKGYVVAAVDYPLSNGDAPGGPNVRDVVNQPGDVSFVIDSLLDRNLNESDSFYGAIDPRRIGIAGLSLGGLTTILTGFHPQWRDPRVKAIASIAGVSAYFDERFFDSTDAPFAMIAGSSDAIVPYGVNAASIPDVDDNAVLVTLDQASHTAFAALAAPMAHWVTHPDEIVCPMLLGNLEDDAEPSAPLFEPDAAMGITAPGPEAAPCRMETFERAMRPGKQLMLTRLALYAFLESALATDADRRRQMQDFLRRTLPAENPDVSVRASAG